MEQTLRNRLVYITALLWVAAQIYIAFAAVPGMIIRPLHVSFCLILVFLLYPALKDRPGLSLALDAGPVLIIIFFMAYSVYYGDRIVTRLPFVDDLFASDYFFNFALVILLLEAGRRVLGWSMTIVALVFMAYSFFGANLPGILAHPVVSIADFVENQTMTSSGIYSSPIAASSDTIFYFMIFGAYLAATPAGTLFVAMAKYATRKAVGGAGKASIIASGLFGMISGSAAANVASVGTIVYPMMEKARYKPVFSAALLATAGTGGQLIPPVMGASAFIMADMIGVSYFKIVLCAIIPSMLYVGSLFWEVHLESYKQQMKPEILDKDELLGSIKRYFHLILPIVILVALIAWGRSLMYSALMSTLSLIVLCQLKKDTRISVAGIIKMAVDGAKSSVIVTLPCAIAGIVIGEVVYTGLGLRFSALIASVSAGNLLLALLLSTVMIIIMGMGMPTSAAYIMSAVLLAPAMQNLGIQPLVAHMFIFYFANMSMITPPVAIASYTAAGIAKTGLWETGVEAVRLALVLFLIPFVFVYNPGLLGIGSVYDIVTVTFFCTVGVLSLGMGVIGHWRGNFSYLLRGAFIAAALCMIVPEPVSSIVGIALFTLLLFYVQMRRRRPAL